MLAILLAERGDVATIRLVESDSARRPSCARWRARPGSLWRSWRKRIEKPATQAKLGPVDVVRACAGAARPAARVWPRRSVPRQPRRLFLKGREVEQEIEAARKLWTFDVALDPSLTEREAPIVVESGDLRSLKTGGMTP